MPSTRPCAAFEPIPPDFDLQALVESSPNFEYAVRINCGMIEHHGLAAFERLVLVHVILGGKPLVIEGYESGLDKWIFAIQWLRDNCGSNIVDARDLTKQVNVPMSIGHYLKHMALLTDQWTSVNYKDPERQRMYLKDIDCPPMWQERVSEHIPPVLFYLNESTGDIGGLGAVDEPDPSGNGVRKGRGIAKAGDLMSSLPKEMRADNLMCYIGHEGTYTPCHREMCASLGHNIMVEASSGAYEDGKATRPGSSIWFMTETKEREVVAEYWLSRLGHDIEVERHFAQINAWKLAPFKTYVVDQKPGDFILIPPLAPHQVWNRGTRTMKIAWNRTTVETVELAMNEALFKARLVCRDEQYKNKAIIYYTLDKYAQHLQRVHEIKQKRPESKKVQKADAHILQLQKDFKRLHALYTRILVEESFYPERPEKKVEMIPFDSNITCSYCRANIFNRFLTCPSCIGEMPDGSQDTYDICLDCYAMGRSCACISKLKWAEQWNWGELIKKHELWRHLIIQSEGQITEKSPRSLRHELDRRGKRRTTAQICQTELLKRPFHDIRKLRAGPERDLEDDVLVDEDGNVKKRKVKKSEKFQRDHGRCHVDCYWEPRWKQAQCTKCDKNYCFGILFRAYDMMPQDILADPQWICPSCLHICNCRHCRKKPNWKRYTPKGTLLGHNTKAVADPRSVESLVDFSYSNLKWIQKADDDYMAVDTRRLQRRRREANAAMGRDPELGDSYVDNDADLAEQDIEGGVLRLAVQEGIPIDPALVSGWTAANATDDPSHAEGDDSQSEEINENPEELGRRPHNGADLDAHIPLPDGGIVQDPNHAYDPTDMITFTYPDPAMTQVPAPPMEGYAEAAMELPYQDADSPTPSGIEMVERKRKRKIDEGDKPFQYKAQIKKKNVSKQRQSLVVRLAISKDKLQDIQNATAAIEINASKVIAAAPVVNSDLQALNVYPSEDAQPPAKRARREERPPHVEMDKEYAPNRSRDRRKLPPDGRPLPPQDANLERRTTRLHNVKYTEPDEEEFDDVVVPKSKLALMNVGDVLDDIEIHRNDSDHESGLDNVQTSASSPEAIGKRPALTTAAALSDRNDGYKIGTTRNGQHSQNMTTGSPSVVKLAVPYESATSKAALEAQVAANRRAKLAATQMDLDDLDDIDEWSTDASDDTPKLLDKLPRKGPTVARQSATAPMMSKVAVAASQKPARRIAITETSIKDRRSDGNPSTGSTSQMKAQHVTNGSGAIGQKSNLQSVSMQRARADDWDDSD